MKKDFIVFFIFIAAIIIGVAYYASQKEGAAPVNEPVSSEIDTAIRNRIVEFGTKLKNVSLLMNPEGVRSQMQTHYSPYLTAELLTAWQNDPGQALGRKTSSPWPDRIDVVEVVRQTDSLYKVEGNIIEVTSADKPNEPAGVLPVSLVVSNQNGVWLISKIEKGSYSELPQRVSKVGFWECLPHKNTSGPQTTECAFGIAIDQSDAHYAISMNLLESGPVNFATGTKIKVEGVLVPANQLSTDIWQKYPIDGIIEVTSIQEVK